MDQIRKAVGNPTATTLSKTAGQWLDGPVDFLLNSLMHAMSFKGFLDETLRQRGFFPGPARHWYKLLGNRLLAVSLHNTWYDKGVYIEYGLTFFKQVPKPLPKTDECIVFGDNPALPKARFKKFEQLLKDVRLARTDPAAQRTIIADVDTQLKCLSSWTSRQKLIQRVTSRKFLEMLVDRKALGLEPD